jgi:hypothetical protein
MDQLTRASAPLANKRRRHAVAESAIAPLTELDRNPVALIVRDERGAHNISAERGKGGKVWLTCQCQQSLSEGWCGHRLDLLCSRFESAPHADAATRQAFARVVAGTPLGEAGLDADRALKGFQACLTAFDEGRPTPVVGKNLSKFTDLVSDLAACAGELEDALGSLRRLLER